jgi:CRISPR/Cas system endoribonuclease Cas6 (RAMP superfamily)
VANDIALSLSPPQIHALQHFGKVRRINAAFSCLLSAASKPEKYLEISPTKHQGKPTDRQRKKRRQKHPKSRVVLKARHGTA